MTNKRKLNFIDLFSGAGGLSLWSKKSRVEQSTVLEPSMKLFSPKQHRDSYFILLNLICGGPLLILKQC